MSKIIEFYESHKPVSAFCGLVCVTACSECGANLTAPGNVTLELYCDDNVFAGHTSVEPVGDAGVGLLEDVDDLVTLGYLNHVECGGCGERLELDRHRRWFTWNEPHEFRASMDEAVAWLASADQNAAP